MKEEKIGKFEKWEVESALRTLEEAEQIKKKDDLIKEIKKLAKIKINQINSIADLKAKANGDDE